MMIGVRFTQRQYDEALRSYQAEVAPIIRERVRLSMYPRGCVIRGDEIIFDDFPPEIAELDARYQEMQDVIFQRHFAPLLS
jgi:hypothetical protein